MFDAATIRISRPLAKVWVLAGFDPYWHWPVLKSVLAGFEIRTGRF
jgi:hypothetical protein